MFVGKRPGARADALELQVFIVVSGRCALEVKFDFVRAAGGISTHSHHLALSTVGEGELIGDIELFNEALGLRLVPVFESS
jgi:hypothetical protein